MNTHKQVMDALEKFRNEDDGGDGTTSVVEREAAAVVAALTPAPEGAPPVGRDAVQYSFDDLHFGTSSNGNKSLTSRLVARPEGLTNAQWYKFAGAMLKALATPAPVVSDAWRDCYNAALKALMAIVTMPSPDKLYDLDAIPRDPVMREATRIKTTLDTYAAALTDKGEAL